MQWLYFLFIRDPYQEIVPEFFKSFYIFSIQEAEEELTIPQYIFYFQYESSFLGVYNLSFQHEPVIFLLLWFLCFR